MIVEQVTFCVLTVEVPLVATLITALVYVTPEIEFHTSQMRQLNVMLFAVEHETVVEGVVPEVHELAATFC
jgi:hypothetical protein